MGPGITGGELRLGPVFYYLQIIPAFFFGAKPETLAWPDLIFSVLFVPLLYFYLRLYFEKNISMVVSAIAATSLFLIIYGRFAWNPNSLPFFSLLTIVGLLKTNWKNRVSPGWFYVAIISAAVATQLHFIYFFIAPFFIAVFLFVWKPGLKLKHYIFCVLIALAFYSPVFLSEMKTGWNNSKFILASVVKKEDKEHRHNPLEKTFRAYQGMQKAYWGIITSDERGNSIDLDGLHLNCDRDCKKTLPLWIFQCFIFLFGIISAISAYRKEKSDRKKFVFAVLLWTGLAFAFYCSIAYLIYPRYYLFVTVSFFALLGFSFDKIISMMRKYGKIIVAVSVILILSSNLRNDLTYLKEHGDMAEGEITNARGSLFFNDEKITLKQLETAADYIAEHKSSAPVRIAVDNTYARSLFYLLQYRRNIPACYVKWSAFSPSGNYDYFLVLRSSVNREIPKDLGDKFIIKDQKIIGNLFIIDIEGKKMNLKDIPQEPCLTS